VLGERKKISENIAKPIKRDISLEDFLKLIQKFVW
jgi:hypothetical protein